MILERRTVVPDYSVALGVRPEILFAIQEKRIKYTEQSMAELLLHNDRTAIYHLDPERTFAFNGQPILAPVLLAVNYSHGHSEGLYKIVVQNVREQKGPWVLFSPPNSGETHFYYQHLVFPHLQEPTFEEEVANPLKIRNYVYHIGDPQQIFSDFQELGYTFVNHPMSQERWRELTLLNQTQE